MKRPSPRAPPPASRGLSTVVGGSLDAAQRKLLAEALRRAEEPRDVMEDALVSFGRWLLVEVFDDDASAALEGRRDNPVWRDLLATIPPTDAAAFTTTPDVAIDATTDAASAHAPAGSGDDATPSTRRRSLPRLLRGARRRVALAESARCGTLRAPMAIATRGSRRLVVGGEAFRWSVDDFYDYGRAQFTVASEDRALLVIFTPAMDTLRVVGGRLPGLPPGARPPLRVRGPRRTPSGLGPAEVAALVAWCLDGSIAKEVVAPDPSRPSWWPWRELSPSLMRPPRAQRDAVLALAVEALGAPADDVARRAWSRSTTRPHRRARSMERVWEALESASLVDAPWVAAHRECVRDPQTALALAADPDGALHAALLAREMAARRGALGRATGDAVVWTLVDDPAPFACDERPGEGWAPAVDEALRASQVAWEEPARDDDDRRPPRAWAYDDARHAARHALAAAQGLRPITGSAAPECSCDEPFDAWPDVFAPLLRVWSLGYGVGAAGAEGVQLVTAPL